MAKLNLFSSDGKAIGTIEASDRVFMVQENENVVNETLNWYLASRRLGNACAKTRAEVSGGGRKPWRQKGTGRARIGDIRAPHWRKGGVVFAPKPRNYSYNLPVKVRKAAIRVVLSDKARGGKLKVVERIALVSPKTKEMVKLLKTFNSNESAVIVLSEPDEMLYRASRNIKGIKLSIGRALNIYDLLKHEEVILTKDALRVLEEAYI